ncbi:uncharacterized protein EKO05_0006155 [Ascochyta rabiei]|nr:uncharacterized protein EKO05_0006155 [Ascochyta rabiei]UPX15715.1 hypothetical protein EKO05_0006155 [Ascochyta rabiei]
MAGGRRKPLERSRRSLNSRRQVSTIIVPPLFCVQPIIS